MLEIVSVGLSEIRGVFVPDVGGIHFNWSLLCVVVTTVSIAWLLNKYRHHDFMTEVVYVWELKQTLNKINRKMMKLKVAGDEGNSSALLAMHYYYEGSSLLWQLDDNTLLMGELATKQTELESLAKTFNLVLNSDEYKEQDLKQF